MQVGTIINYFAEKGFGFIRSEEGEEFLFHCNSVDGDRTQLRRGLVAQFATSMDKDGRYRAVDVRLTGDTKDYQAQRRRSGRRLAPYSGPTLALSAEQRAAALAEIARWKVEAKLEDIKRYFYTVPELDDILDGGASFVIGRKGTGNTALVEYLSERPRDNIITTKLTFKNFPFNELYGQTNSSYTRPNQFITI